MLHSSRCHRHEQITQGPWQLLQSQPSHLLGPVGSPSRVLVCCSWWGVGRGYGSWPREPPPPATHPTPYNPQGDQTCSTQRQPGGLTLTRDPESDPTPPRLEGVVQNFFPMRLGYRRPLPN